MNKERGEINLVKSEIGSLVNVTVKYEHIVENEKNRRNDMEW